MSKIITILIELMSATLEWLHTNLDGIIVSIVAAVILSLIHYIKNKPKEINELLKCKNFNDINWIDDLDKSLEIKNTMKRHFPEYTDYLLIQYGSSVESNNRLPQDYDFIVLMLGIPKNGKRYLHNKGTTSSDDVSSKENINQVDIVYRDYLSFLYAASAGMPYENSVIITGKLLKGHIGYFQWLKNITKNQLYNLYVSALEKHTQEKISQKINNNVIKVFAQFTYFTEYFYYKLENEKNGDEESLNNILKYSEKELFKLISDNTHSGIILFSEFDSFDTYIDDIINEPVVCKYANQEDLSTKASIMY